MVAGSPEALSAGRSTGLARRALGLLLILKALSPFIWLFVAYLLVGAIGDRFAAVSGGTQAELTIQFDAYDKLAEDLARQVDAAARPIEAVAEQAMGNGERVVAYLQDTAAQLKALPRIDLSRVMPELNLPPIVLPTIDLDWQVPSIPLVSEVVRAVQGAVQGAVNSSNAAIAALASEVRAGVQAALAPLRNELVANIRRQVDPYVNAYERVSASMKLAGDYYDSVADGVAYLQGALAQQSASWAQLGAAFLDQFSISLQAVDTGRTTLGTAFRESAVLLALFGVLTLALFLVGYWASMMRDLRCGWSLLTGRYEGWKQRQATGEPPLDRLLARLERRQA